MSEIAIITLVYLIFVLSLECLSNGYFLKDRKTIFETTGIQS